jgi:hypothetical protein
MNALLGSMSLKEKFQVVLNQQGRFACPSRKEETATAAMPVSPVKAHPSLPHSMEARLAVVVDDLRKRGTAKPRTVKTLSSTIGATFQKTLSEAEVKGLLDRLSAKGYVLVDGTKVTYDLPAK